MTLRTRSLTPEQIATLRAAGPHLYAPQENVLPWGFETHAGWYDLLLQLTQAIESALLAYPEEHQKLCSALQVKTKFGRLSFYLTVGPKMTSIVDLVVDAEQRSATVCEHCGAAARSQMIGDWVVTLCDEHYAGELAAYRGESSGAKGGSSQE